VEAFVSGAALIVAHNAKFDRPMCETTWPFFRNLNWACSCTQIPWEEEGHEGVKLGYLLNDYGRFHNGHSAIDDLPCGALPARPADVEVQAPCHERASRQRAKDPIPALGRERALRFQGRFEESRLSLVSSEARCWSIILEETALPDEADYLRREVYGGQPIELRRDKLSAGNRFSLAT
jgi:DNA polymerase III subunit epsilon